MTTPLNLQTESLGFVPAHESALGPEAEYFHEFVPEVLQRPQGDKWEPSRRSSSLFKDPSSVTPTAPPTRSSKERLAALKKVVTDNKHNINASKKDGNTILHLAVKGEHLQFVTFLIQETAINVSAKNTRGEVPLHLALRNPECTRILLSKSISEADSLDSEGNAPLHLAAQASKADSLHILILTGKANVETPNKDGETPLHTAARVGSLACVRALIKVGNANVDALDSNGNTPLHAALLKDHTKCIRFLATEGKANLYRENLEGLSFKKRAEENPESEYAEIFKNSPLAKK